MKESGEIAHGDKHVLHGHDVHDVLCRRRGQREAVRAHGQDVSHEIREEFRVAGGFFPVNAETGWAKLVKVLLQILDVRDEAVAEAAGLLPGDLETEGNEPRARARSDVIGDEGVVSEQFPVHDVPKEHGLDLARVFPFAFHEGRKDVPLERPQLHPEHGPCVRLHLAVAQPFFIERAIFCAACQFQLLLRKSANAQSFLFRHAVTS